MLFLTFFKLICLLFCVFAYVFCGLKTMYIWHFVVESGFICCPTRCSILTMVFLKTSAIQSICYLLTPTRPSTPTTSPISASLDASWVLQFVSSFAFKSLSWLPPCLGIFVYTFKISQLLHCILVLFTSSSSLSFSIYLSLSCKLVFVEFINRSRHWHTLIWCISGC